MSAQPAPKVVCSTCEAVCCRLTVLLEESDRIPGHLTARTAHGLLVMARDDEGWCVAIDHNSMRCSIYDDRPSTCRRFVMSGPYCRDVRKTYEKQVQAGIPLTLY
ncbi:MAG TPA: zinc/iron-chelating domain-containing protein [Xanthomonadaceae bacterium]|nr:zinc/iron-chelating domain-containing protein [Xanthomonadaceae bacterium]